MMNRPDDHEAKMARADLFKLAQYSFKLFKMIQENQELEGWVQAKITKAADYISSVYHYMQYEMKVSEYGDHLENAEMYSESVRRAYEQKLTEARNMAIKAKMRALGEGSKEDYDYYFGKDKPNSEGPKTKELSKHTATKSAYGTQYTKRDLPGQDTADDADEKKMKRKAKKERQKTSESGMYTAQMGQPPSPPDTAKPGAGTFTVGPFKGLTPQEAMAHPLYKTNPKLRAEVDKAMEVMRHLDKSAPLAAKKMQEALKGNQKKLDADKDGKLEKSDFAKLRAGKNVKEAAKPDYIDLDKDGNKKEPMKKAAKDKKVDEAAKCNHTPKGKSCPVHGIKECGGMYEASHQAKTTMKHVKNPTAGEKAAAKDIKPGVKGYSDRAAMLKSAEKDGRLKEARPSAGMSKAEKSAVVKKAKAGGDIGQPGKGFKDVEAAAKKGGAKDPKAVAAAAMWKQQAKK